MEDDPETFEPIRPPFVPGASRRKQRRVRPYWKTKPITRQVADDSPYLETGDRLQELDIQRGRY